MRSLGVISAKGGVGKTAISVNLSAAMMKLGVNVILVDSDVKVSGVGLQLGMYSFDRTLNDVLCARNANPLEVISIHSSGLRIIPASICARKANLDRLGRFLKHRSLAQSKFIIDTPPGMENSISSILKVIDDAIVVTTPDIPSVADAMMSIKAARSAGCNVLGIVVNKHRKGIFSQLRTREIEDACGVHVIGAVPEDPGIQRSIFMRTPLVVMKPNSPASRSIIEIAKNICKISLDGGAR
jgi:flagellar biosynthesis protein FlhG